MYTSFFGLREKPFDLLPNPDFLYPSRAHQRALTYLTHGIRERAGFILLTGEVGSGKTTLIRNMIRSQLRDSVLAKVFNTRVDSLQLLMQINGDFGLETEGKDKSTLLRELNDFLIEQYAHRRQAVLIIDEAQNLSVEILEEVRMLSNLETDRDKLLQVRAHDRAVKKVVLGGQVIKGDNSIEVFGGGDHVALVLDGRDRVARAFIDLESHGDALVRIGDLGLPHPDVQKAAVAVVGFKSRGIAVQDFLAQHARAGHPGQHTAFGQGQFLFEIRGLELLGSLDNDVGDVELAAFLHEDVEAGPFGVGLGQRVVDLGVVETVFAV